MALRRTPSAGGSFYESFTDLIFGALVLFIVVVIGLALRLRQVERQVDEHAREVTDEVRSAVSVSRFSGAPARTAFVACHLPIDGVTHLVPLEASFSDLLDYLRWKDNEEHDPLLDLCRLALNPDRYVAIEAPRVRATAKGVSAELFDRDRGAIDYPEAGLVLYVGRQLLASGTRWTPEAMRMAISLPSDDVNEHHTFAVGSAGELRDDRLREPVRAYYEWLQAGHGWQDTNRTVPATEIGTPPSVRFGLREERAMAVGEAALSVAEFQAFIQAIKPGQGFHLQFLDARGRPATYPSWLLEQVLDPLGFQGFVVLDAAADLVTEAALAEVR